MLSAVHLLGLCFSSAHLQPSPSSYLSQPLHGSDLVSRGLSFDGEVWDFEGEEAMVDVIDGTKAYSMFGYSVSVHDNKMIVGAVGANNSQGSAYIYYRHEDEVWRLDKQLTLEYPADYDQFGCAVAIYEYTAVIGANKRESDDGWKTDAGAAYIYEKESQRWEMTMDLTPDDVTAQDYFGSSVALYANTTVIGCWGCDSMGSFSGAAYIYSKWDGEWQFDEKIFASNGARYNWFGISVAIQKDVIVVGATGVVSTYTLEKSGAAYVFCNVNDDQRYEGKRYVECAELIPGDGRNGDAFGTSVAIHHDIVVVGAPMADHKNGAPDIGAAYMFFQDNHNDWHFVQKMFAYEPTMDGHFGQAVGVYDDIVAVGGYNASGSGAVYVYGEEYELSDFEKDTNAVWQLAFILKPDGGEVMGDFYGYSISVYGATIAVGAYGLEVTRSVNGGSQTLIHAGGVFSYYGGKSRIQMPSKYVSKESSASTLGKWMVGSAFILMILLLGTGSTYLLYNKRMYGEYFPTNRNDSYPISDWLPSSFNKAFGTDGGDYSATSLDSSHGISSSHGMISSDQQLGGISNSSAVENKDDLMNKIFEDDDVDKDQQMLDDSLSKFQLKRQNRISIKKKKHDGS